MMKQVAVAAAILAAGLGGHARAGEIYSDLPIKPAAGQTIWPRVASNIMTLEVGLLLPAGDWKIDMPSCAGNAHENCTHWARLRLEISQPGVSYRLATARLREHLDDGDLAWLIELGPDVPQAAVLEIRTGGPTRYILLASDDPHWKTVKVFDASCQDSARRHGTYSDAAKANGYFTDYCSIASMTELIAIAREALKHPPSEVWNWVAPEN